MKITRGLQDTRRNNEDFALTPYLFGVKASHEKANFLIIGIGLCWGYWACYVGLGFNLPKDYPTKYKRKR